MRNRINYLVSHLLGLLIILSVAGLPTEIFGYTKTFAVFGIAGLSLITVSLLPFAMHQKVKITPLSLFCLLFLPLYLINFSNIDNLWNIGYSCLITLFIAICILKHIHYSIIFKYSLCAAAILTIWGYLQYFQYIPSNSKHFVLTGPFHNPAVLAVMLSLLMSIAINSIILYYKLLKKNKFLLMLIGIVITFCTPLFIMTNARAAYLSILVSTLYSLLHKYHMNIPKKKMFAIFCRNYIFDFNFYRIIIQIETTICKWTPVNLESKLQYDTRQTLDRVWQRRLCGKLSVLSS